jgi:hypothetical protein
LTARSNGSDHSRGNRAARLPASLDPGGCRCTRVAALEHHVTEKALDGLFLMIGEEEKKIRANPAGTGSAILTKVFGSL